MREQIRSMDLHCVGEKHAIRYLLIEYYQDYLYLPFNYHKLTNIILIYVKTSNLIKKSKSCLSLETVSFLSSQSSIHILILQEINQLKVYRYPFAKSVS